MCLTGCIFVRVGNSESHYGEETLQLDDNMIILMGYNRMGKAAPYPQFWKRLAVMLTDLNYSWIFIFFFHLKEA